MFTQYISDILFVFTMYMPTIMDEIGLAVSSFDSKYFFTTKNGFWFDGFTICSTKTRDH